MPAPSIDDLRAGTAAAYLPPEVDHDSLAEAAQGCRGCDLWRNATQAVLGEGPSTARLMFVGEQPGDVEDETGRPFVGPAGRLLDRALEEAGIDREDAYVTNAVKHFKWQPRGKRRLHQRPNAEEIDACGPWLVAEIEWVRPEVVIPLGATAAQALLGRSFRVTRARGQVYRDTGLAPCVMATVHPSSILRARTSEEREEALARFVDDLRVAGGLIA